MIPVEALVKRSAFGFVEAEEHASLFFAHAVDSAIEFDMQIHDHEIRPSGRRPMNFTRMAQQNMPQAASRRRPECVVRVCGQLVGRL